ncbi:hypothetical protein BGX30_013551 [Mortierella sp. GBA39]|nr:hypothetical protein BGX30_013551 [Mortierella sp. GBA39]
MSKESHPTSPGSPPHAAQSIGNKSVSSQRIRTRDKFKNFFRSSSSGPKVKQPLSSKPKAADHQLSTTSTKTSFHHLSTVSTHDSVDIEYAVSNTEVTRSASKVQPTVLSTEPRLDVFLQNVDKPAVFISLPKFGSRIETTSQLALCIGLLPKRLDITDKQDILPQDLFPDTVARLVWIKAAEQDPTEQDRILWLGARMVDEFAKDASKDSTEIAEMVLLGPVLDKETYRRLLQCTITSFDQCVLLEVDLLQGLVQLVQSSPSGSLVSDDLVKIFSIIRARLQGTHGQSSEYSYHLTQAVARILDVMAEHKVQGLDRVEEHEPLSGVLSSLKGSSDPYLMYQACYAFQALQYVPNNESPLHAVLRHSTGVIGGLVKVSAVMKLDLGAVLEGLNRLQEALGSAVVTAVTVYEGARSLVESGKSVFESLKEGLGSGQKRPWYTAIRIAYALVQAGQLKDLNVLIYKAPCRRDPLFQWGICQLLGEIAFDEIWDFNVRLQAVDLLGELYKTDTEWGQDESVKTWMLNIIRQLRTVASQDVRTGAITLLKDLNQDQCTTTDLPHPLRNRLPLPDSSPTLARVQNIPPLEYDLHQFRDLRLEQSRLSIYISAFAKPSLRAKDEDIFPLMEKVQEFLASERQVMLVLGDSGSGKSTFNRHLEYRLWTDYKQGGPIPLFINLPAIDRPDVDLITKQLRANNFSDEQIQEMKQHRQLILICDGYDESQQLVNLHHTNMLNQSGQWNTKMAISCRTQFLGPSYLDRFKPQPTDRYASGSQDLFQEAVIAPFSKDQIERYVDLYAQDPHTALLFSNQSVWSAKEYMDKLAATPNVNDLIKNPFLLTLALRALPGLAASNKDLSSLRVTRVGLYDMFVDQWLETNRLRMQTSTLSKEELTAFNSLVDEDFIGCGIDYLLGLSAAIFQKQDGNPVVQYLHRQDKDSWKAAFFGSDPEVKLLREASPLMRTGNQYRFVHRSMLEYFLSRVIYNPVMVNEEEVGSHIETASTSFSSNSTDPLFQRNLLEEPSIIQFLCDRVRLHPEFERQLRAIIDRSKTDSSATIAATNAITILVRAGVAFNGADLRGINIPGADVSGGQFDSAQLQGADLTGVNLTRSWLRQADLSHAQLEGVQFGELPYLKMKGEVKACAFSPDGNMLGLALWSDDLGIRIYDTSTWQQIHGIACNKDVNSVAFSPDSQRIVSGGHDGMVRLWDCRDGEELIAMEGHTSYVWSVAFSLCGKQIASGSSDETVRLWDAQTGAILFILEGHTDRVLSVKFLSDGWQLVSGSYDGTIRFWNSGTGEPGVVRRASLRGVQSLAVSPDGRRIAFGHYGGDVQLWSMDSGDPGPVLQDHTRSVLGIAFSPDSQLIASASRDNKVILWDSSRGDIISRFGDHSGEVCDIAFSPDGLTIASGSDDSTVRLWEANSSRSNIEMQDYIGGASQVAYSLDGLSILSVDRHRIVREGDATTGARGPVLFEFPDPQSIKTQAFSSDGNQIATAGRDGLVRLWDTHTGVAGPVLEGHSREVCNLAYSTCGRWIASYDIDTNVRLWDLHDIKQRYRLVYVGGGYGNRVTGLKFSPTGHQLAVCSWEGRVWLFDPRTRALLTCKELREEPIWTLDYSPNGQQLALGTRTSIVFWDHQSDEPGVELEVPGYSKKTVAFTSVAYSPCGQSLLSCNADNIVRLWQRRADEDEAENWSCVSAIRVFLDPVTSLSWNPAVPAEFLTASEDGSIQAWRVSNDDGGVTVKMLWGANLRRLCAEGVVLGDATSLSPIYQHLLAQRSAFNKNSV